MSLPLCPLSSYHYVNNFKSNCNQVSISSNHVAMDWEHEKNLFLFLKIDWLTCWKFCSLHIKSRPDGLLWKYFLSIRHLWQKISCRSVSNKQHLPLIITLMICTKEGGFLYFFMLAGFQISWIFFLSNHHLDHLSSDCDIRKTKRGYLWEFKQK